MKPGSFQRGGGAFSIEQQERILKMLVDGETQRKVAQTLSVTKNTIAGIWRRYGTPVSKVEPTTIYDRCAALHARMDAVLAATVGIGRIAVSDYRPESGVTEGRNDAT